MLNLGGKVKTDSDMMNSLMAQDKLYFLAICITQLRLCYQPPSKWSAGSVYFQGTCRAALNVDYLEHSVQTENTLQNTLSNFCFNHKLCSVNSPFR